MSIKDGYPSPRFCNYYLKADFISSITPPTFSIHLVIWKEIPEERSYDFIFNSVFMSKWQTLQKMTKMVFLLYFIFKTFIIYFYYYYFWPQCTACGILVLPDQGCNPSPLQWKCRVSTTGPPGKSPKCYFYILKI